ncbi:MAG: GNAT family N-acetyltransferase [Anaerolineaceae bacterium]|nr:GNAT family N-acetyltransferase [Anaerolineaceae bacterium]
MMADEYIMRKATLDDIPMLVKHRRWMFEDIAKLNHADPNPAGLDAMDEAYAIFADLHMRDGSLTVWVIEYNGEMAASGSLSIMPWLPRPVDPVGQQPYVHGIYTLAEHRRKGLARRIMEAIVAECRQKKYFAIKLNASTEGQSLYESLGFHPTNEMLLELK